MKTVDVVANVVQTLLTTKNARRVTKIVSPTEAVKATRQRKVDGRKGQQVMLVTIGRPNFIERRFIKSCVKAGEPFPVKKVRVQYFPKKAA